MRLILASSSPRRESILRGLDIDFETRPPLSFAEEIEGDPKDVVRINALGKAKDVARQISEGVVVGCDTVVVLSGTILGKPSHERDAQSMLHRLSGKWHTVISGVAIVSVPKGKEVVGIEETRVKFRDLTDEEIDSYVATGEPLDKAGAYGIQGRGELLIEKIEGSISNVVGLPKRLLLNFLGELDI